VHYGGIRAVKGIDLEVSEGELVCLIGANGAGKTSTLKAICRVIASSAAAMTYSGKDISRAQVHELPRHGRLVEQQMLAIARALMGDPRLLLLDEPSMGLAPMMVARIFEVVREIAARGVTILLVEQNARLALELAHRGYVMESGAISLAGKASDLLNNPKVREAYLGEVAG